MNAFLDTAMFLQAAAATVGLYAIFLVPEQEGETYLNQELLIESLSDEFGDQTGGPKFAPHLPLLTDISVEEPGLVAPLMAAMDAASAEVEPFNVTFAAEPLHSFDIWQQGLVAFVNQSSALTDALVKFTHTIQGSSVEPTWQEPAAHPHMPLMLGTLGNVEVPAIAMATSSAPWLFDGRTTRFTAAQLWAITPLLSEVTEESLVHTVQLGRSAAAERTLVSKSNKQAAATAETHRQQKQEPRAAKAKPESAPAAAKAHVEKPVQEHPAKPDRAAAHAGSGAPGTKAGAKADAKADAKAHA